jgi:membrane associated rhomboid family serine protease
MIPIHDSQPSQSTPWVTSLLIAVNVFIFLYQVTLDPFTRNDFTFHYGFVPARFTLESLLTSMFLHGGWMHLIGNMLFLWVFGDNIEDILGHGRFLLFYLLCGVAAALLQFAINPGSRIPMVGASGAIYGVMGAYAVKFPHARISMVGWFLFLFTFEVPAWVVMIYYLGVNLVSGFGAIADVMNERGGVAFFAHVGGFAAGVGLVLLMRTRVRSRLRQEAAW